MKKLDQRGRLAEIRWVPSCEGGRERLASGSGEPHYAPIVRLLDPDEVGPAPVIWSLAVRKLEEVEDSDEWLAEIAYLMPEAPHEELTIGRRFELYEGARCVATGVVLGTAGDRSICSAMLEPFD
jgi:hypothetical protein